MWFSDHFAEHVRLYITPAQSENFDFCICKSVRAVWSLRRAKLKKSKHSAHLFTGVPGQCCPAELTLQPTVSIYLPQSVCFLSPSRFIRTPLTNNQQMDQNNTSLDAVRTPQETCRTEPHWPVSDPTGVPLNLTPTSWNFKYLWALISIWAPESHMRKEDVFAREGAWNVSRHQKYGSNYWHTSTRLFTLA